MVRKPFVALSLAMAALTALALTMLFTGPGVSANDGDDTPNIPERRELIYPNLGSHLDAVVASYESGRQSERQAAEQGVVSQDGAILVTIYLSSNVAGVESFLNDNGVTARNVGEDYIEAYVPVGLLGQVSQQDGVTRVREIIPPEPMYGNVTSQGVGLHLVPAWHTAGYKGKGVKVGIIDAGYYGWRSLQGVELPSTVGGVRCYYQDRNRSVDYGGLELCDDREWHWAAEHGTASGETIIDIAPEATLYLSDPYTWGDLQEVVRWMVSEGVQVINMSMAYGFDGPGDGTSPYSNSPLNAVDTAVSGGIIWLNSAGNYAEGTWFGAFTDSDNDNDHEWGGTDEGQQLYLLEDTRVTIQLRWDDQWRGATKDLDLFLLNQATNQTVDSSTDRQEGGTGDDPYERISYTAPADGYYDVLVKKISGDAPEWLQLTVWGADSNLQHHTKSGSITSPAESANPGLLAVGASPWYDTSKIEYYSSQGPAPDGRVKPDITGATCGLTVSYPPYLRRSDNQQVSYCGTSGSSPHLAGLAALVRQANPSFTPQQTANYLKTNAAERGAAGADNVWGYGFAQMPAAPTTPPPADPCTSEITADGATTGAWAANCVSQVASPDPADAADAKGYARYYTFTTTEQKTVTISLDSGVDTYLYLRSGDAKSGTPVAENDDKVSGNTNSEISQSLAAGTYTIEATTYKAATAGDFTLTLSGLGGTGGTPPPASDACPAAATALTADGANSGTWDNTCVSQIASPDSSDAADAKGYARYYTLTPAEAREVTITLESTEDTYLYLRQGADVRTGAAVAENDDIVSGNTNSRVTATLAANTAYTVEATTYRAATEGSFTLTLAGLSDSGGGTPPPAADPCPAAATALTADGVSQGTWDSACVSLEGSPDTTDGADAKSYAAYYTFTAKADEVTITLESAQDTYLSLREGDNVRTGDAVATNDDIDTAARNYNSRITETLTAGTTYTIEATTYKAAMAGSFTLTIDGLGTPPPPACTLNLELTPGQSCAHSAAGLVVFTAKVESNGDLLLRFSGATAPLSRMFFTRSGNNWTITGLP